MRSIYYTISFLVLISSCKSEPVNQKDNTTPTPVKVAKIKTKSMVDVITATGKVQAKNSADISTRVMGFIEKIHVNIGDEVKENQTLITVNNRDLKAKLGQVEANIIKAEAAFKNAEKDYNRFKKLYEQQSASEKELDNMTTNYKVAKANLKSLKEVRKEVKSQFDYANIKAPFSGIITSKNIKIGDITTPGLPLLTIENNKKLEVVVLVAESDITKIKKGEIVTVTIKSIEKRLVGKVSEISLSSKNTGSQYLVKISLKELPHNVLSGMFAQVEFPIDETSITTHKILIPKKAIINQGELTGVYTISETNKALLRWVRLGKTYNDQIEVISGMSNSETYIISSEGRLFNGVSVTIKQ